jgi:hypothetical protein
MEPFIIKRVTRAARETFEIISNIEKEIQTEDRHRQEKEKP